MRLQPCDKTKRLALALALLAAAWAAACGDEAKNPPDMDAGSDAGTDTDTDTDTGTGSDTSYDCTADEIDAQNAAIQAALAEALPCFTGGIIPMPSAVNAYFMLAPDETSLALCADSTADEIAVNNYEADAVAALEGMELICLGNSTAVAGGTAADVGALRAAIDALTEPADPPADAGADAGPIEAPCAVDGLADPLYVVDVGADGGLADIHPAAADTTPETAAYATCLAAALAGLGLPCLAEMEICSAYP
jgi:hypothetical protein